MGPGRLHARYAEYLPEWPKGVAPLPERPAEVMAWDVAGSTVIIGQQRFDWK
jgi:hypothetical protein